MSEIRPAVTSNPPAGDPPPAPAPAAALPTPPTPAPAGNPPAADANAGGNDENKWRRLHEAEEQKRKALETKVQQLEAAESERKKAEMSDAERAKTEAAEAKTRAEKAEQRASELEREKLISQIAAEHHLTAEARELLQGADEAALRANAVKLAAIMKQPAQAGTNTNPARGGGGELTLEQQLAKATSPVERIRLKREIAARRPE